MFVRAPTTAPELSDGRGCHVAFPVLPRADLGLDVHVGAEQLLAPRAQVPGRDDELVDGVARDAEHGG